MIINNQQEYDRACKRLNELLWVDGVDESHDDVILLSNAIATYDQRAKVMRVIKDHGQYDPNVEELHILFTGALDNMIRKQAENYHDEDILHAWEAHHYIKSRSYV